MGAAAYNRGSRAISEQIAREATPENAILLRELNAMPKRDGAPRPFGPVHFVPGNGGWWAQCPVSGFGYHYRTLREAVQALRVAVVEVGMRRGEICYVASPEEEH